MMFIYVLFRGLCVGIKLIFLFFSKGMLLGIIRQIVIYVFWGWFLVFFLIKNYFKNVCVCVCVVFKSEEIGFLGLFCFGGVFSDVILIFRSYLKRLSWFYLIFGFYRLVRMIAIFVLLQVDLIVFCCERGDVFWRVFNIVFYFGSWSCKLNCIKRLF